MAWSKLKQQTKTAIASKKKRQALLFLQDPRGRRVFVAPWLDLLRRPSVGFYSTSSACKTVVMVSWYGTGSVDWACSSRCRKQVTKSSASCCVTASMSLTDLAIKQGVNFSAWFRPAGVMSRRMIRSWNSWQTWKATSSDTTFSVWLRAIFPFKNTPFALLTSNKVPNFAKLAGQALDNMDGALHSCSILFMNALYVFWSCTMFHNFPMPPANNLFLAIPPNPNFKRHKLSAVNVICS